MFYVVGKVIAHAVKPLITAQLYDKELEGPLNPYPWNLHLHVKWKNDIFMIMGTLKRFL